MTQPPDTVDADVALDAEFEAMSEREFQAWVEDIACENSWLVHHCRDSRSNSRSTHPGIGDLIMVRSGVMIYAELKVKNRKMDEGQEEWMDAMKEVEGWTYDSLLPDIRPFRTFLWYPLNRKQIIEVLA